MNQNTMDQNWQQLQLRIDKLVNPFLKDDCPAIEYKTRIAGLLQLPSEYSEESVEKMS